MSRRLYRETALVIRRALDESYDAAHEAPVSDVAKGFADAFRNDNPNFTYCRWFDACSLDPWGAILPNPVHPESENG